MSLHSKSITIIVSNTFRISQVLPVRMKAYNMGRSKSQRVVINYKFIGYMEMKKMIGLPMVIPIVKDVGIEVIHFHSTED